MRKAALLFVFAVCAYAAKAQFTLQPRLGFEAPITKISYNGSGYDKPVSQALPQAGVRAAYGFKNALAPFLGVSTHRPLVSYSFNDPKTGMTAYNATAGNLQVQLQAGLQYNSKPISLSKKKAAATTNPENVSETKSSCRSYFGCYRKSNGGQKQQANAWTMKVQPSVGLGYVPSGKDDIEIQNAGTTNTYTYNAGNIKTELITGLAFEFASGNKKFATLSINYFKGLGNNETVLTTVSDGKTLNTNLGSKLEGWNAAIGIPISFGKKSATTKTKVQSKSRSRCSENYKSRCSRYREI